MPGLDVPDGAGVRRVAVDVPGQVHGGDGGRGEAKRRDGVTHTVSERNKKERDVRADQF